MHKNIYIHIYINKSKGNHTTCKARNGQNKMIKKSQQTNKIQFHSKTGIHIIIGEPRLTSLSLRDYSSRRIIKSNYHYPLLTYFKSWRAINRITPRVTELLKELLHTLQHCSTPTITPPLAALTPHCDVKLHLTPPVNSHTPHLTECI